MDTPERDLWRRIYTGQSQLVRRPVDADLPLGQGLQSDLLVDPVGRVESPGAQLDEAAGFQRLPIVTYDPKEPRGNSGVHGCPAVITFFESTTSGCSHLNRRRLPLQRTARPGPLLAP